MADTYSIKLRLDVDDSALTRTEQRLRKVENTPLRRRVDDRPGPIYSRILRRLGGSPSGFMEGSRIIHNRWDRFSAGFLGNLLSPSGFLTNTSNFARALSSVGTLMGKSFPVINGAIKALQIGLKAGAGITAYRIARGVVPVMIGNRLLNSEQLGNAASSLMQMRMAQIGLGGEYAGALKQATGIAAEYGYSRAGIISAINMFRGLDIGGGNRITTAQASQLAKIIGKISHTGNAPYERVSLNLQQLLGQNVPSGRDIRELITAAPLIGKLAQQSMFRNTGSVGNIQEYLKDKGRLLEVLAEFDKQVESNPYLQARGTVAMAKENFFMGLVSGNAQGWQKMASGISRFFENMLPIASMAIDAVANLMDESKIDLATVVISKWGQKIIKFLGLTNRELDMIAGIDPETGTAIKKTFDPVSGIMTESKVGRSEYGSMGKLLSGNLAAERAYLEYQRGLAPSKADIEARLGRTLSTTEYETFLNAFTLSPSSYLTRIKGVSQEFFRTPRDQFGRISYGNVDKWIPTGLHENGFPLYTGVSTDPLGRKTKWQRSPYKISTPYTTGVNWAGIQDYFANFGTNLGNVMAQTTDSATRDLENISRGSRALVINFNKEIVSMPINIDSVSDGTDLGARLMNLLRANIVEGLNVALNNATGAI